MARQRKIEDAKTKTSPRSSGGRELKTWDEIRELVSFLYQAIPLSDVW